MSYQDDMILLLYDSVKIKEKKGITMEQKQTVFTEIIFQWLSSNNTQITYSTFVKYEQLIRNHIKPYFDHFTCSDLNAQVLEKFYYSLRGHSNMSQLSESNIRTILMIVNHSFEYAYNHQMLRESFHIKPCLPKSKPIVRVFSAEEQSKLEKYVYCHKDSYSLAVLLALYSGIRIGELCALKWKDIDFDNDSVKITKTVQRLKSDPAVEGKTELMVSSPKSRSSHRIIPLPKFVMEYLYEFYTLLNNKEFFLIGGKALPCEPRTLQYAYKRILKKCEIRYLNFHCLRHTFATRCVTIGWDVKTLSEILGHSDIKITMDYYFHSSFEYKKSQMNKLFLLSQN